MLLLFEGHVLPDCHLFLLCISRRSRRRALWLFFVSHVHSALLLCSYRVELLPLSADDMVLALAKLREADVKFRVLGLSATPGSSREAIQVCLGLHFTVLSTSSFTCDRDNCLWP